MNRRISAEHFSATVDQILARRGKAEQGPVIPVEDAYDLELARKLADVDMSAESRLLHELPERFRPTVTAQPAGLRPFRLVLTPATLAALAVAVALAMVQCTYPGGVPAASKEVSRAVSNLVLSELQVGPHTVAQQSTGDRKALDEAVAAIPQEEKDRMWYVNAGGAGFGGSSPKGVGPAALELPSVSEARGKASFAFTIPGHLPAGAAISKVYVSPVGDDVILEYSGAGFASFAISEFAVSSSASSESGLYASSKAGVISDAPYKQTTVGNGVAAWYQTGGVLVWEKGGISFIRWRHRVWQKMRLAASLNP